MLFKKAIKIVLYLTVFNYYLSVRARLYNTFIFGIWFVRTVSTTKIVALDAGVTKTPIIDFVPD